MFETDGNSKEGTTTTIEVIENCENSGGLVETGKKARKAFESAIAAVEDNTDIEVL